MLERLGGEWHGSHFILDLGEKVPRDYRIENPTLTEVQRTFRGELSLFVECAWRLDSKSSVIPTDQTEISFVGCNCHVDDA